MIENGIPLPARTCDPVVKEALTMLPGQSLVVLNDRYHKCIRTAFAHKGWKCAVRRISRNEWRVWRTE